MNRTAIRVWMTGALMALGWLSTAWVRSGYTFEVQPLAQDLSALPRELDGYTGEDIPLADRVREILGADAVVNRMYRHSNGTSMVVHASAWVRPESVNSVAPHSPKICYTSTGWKILKEQTVDISTISGGKLPLCVLLLEREDERCVVAYCYRMGNSFFNTANEARQIHRNLWGERKWPPTIKVLLHTPAREIDAALPRIEKFATSVLQFTDQL